MNLFVRTDSRYFCKSVNLHQFNYISLEMKYQRDTTISGLNEHENSFNIKLALKPLEPVINKP